MPYYAPSLPIITNTRANLLASTPTISTGAYATDTQEFFVYLVGTGWLAFPLEADNEPAAPDMGLQWPSVYNDKSGYSRTYITDKTLSNVAVKGNVTTEEGAIRISSGVYQVYLNGQWNDIVINFRFREEAAGGYELEHKPVGFTEWIEVSSGNGNTLGLNGLPLVQQYSMSMGVYPVNVQIRGRTFS